VCGERLDFMIDLLVRDVIEIIGFVPYLVRISQSYAQQALTAWFKRDDVLSGREHDLADRNHAFLTDGFPNDGERLHAHLTVGCDVIRIVQVQYVNLILGHKFVNVDRALALDRDSFEIGADQVATLVQVSGIPLRAIAPEVGLEKSPAS
jgi:hypothetical protein